MSNDVYAQTIIDNECAIARMHAIKGAVKMALVKMALKKTCDSQVVCLETDTHDVVTYIELTSAGQVFATMQGKGDSDKQYLGNATRKAPRTFSPGSVFREADGEDDMILVAVPHQGAGRVGPGDRWAFFINRYHEAVGPTFAVEDPKAITQAEIDKRFGVGKVVPYDD